MEGAEFAKILKLNHDDILFQGYIIIYIESLSRRFKMSEPKKVTVATPYRVEPNSRLSYVCCQHSNNTL